MENNTFKSGKYIGKTYKEVRINHPEYFIYLITQPVCNVYDCIDFIKYCMGYLTREDTEKEVLKYRTNNVSSDNYSWPPSVNQR